MMNSDELYEKYISLLISANDENLTDKDHQINVCKLNSWLDGLADTKGIFFNGDYYYIVLGIDRPMCCGQFLDWKSKMDSAA